MNVPAQRRSAPQPITVTSLVRGLQKGDDVMRSVALAKEVLATPANTEWIAGRMVTLLSHYFQPGQDPNVSAAAGSDWMSILSPFPQVVIETACNEWLSTKHHRPTPAHMVELCHRHRDRIRDAMPRQQEPDAKPVNRVQADRAKQIIQEVLGNRGDAA